LLSAVVAAVGYLYPRVRLVEDELPDAMPEAASEAEAEVQTRDPELIPGD
jgi:hypothetical protein